MTFHGKLQFENGGAPLERDNFAFCKVMTNLVDIGGYLKFNTSNLFVLQLVELSHDELGDKSKNSIRFEFSDVIQLSQSCVELNMCSKCKR